MSEEVSALPCARDVGLMTAPPPPMGSAVSYRVQQAIARAKYVYPGPIGELVADELRAWLVFGFRFGSHSLAMRIVDDVLSRAERGEAA